jgi:hypothetical protein
VRKPKCQPHKKRAQSWQIVPRNIPQRLLQENIVQEYDTTAAAILQPILKEVLCFSQ